jgi:MFS family permease
VRPLHSDPELCTGVVLYLGANICAFTGPVTGGYLTEATSWRWVFWVLAIAVSALHQCPLPLW